MKYYDVPTSLPHAAPQSVTTCSSSPGFGIYIDECGKLHNIPPHVLAENKRQWEYEDACACADKYQGKVLI